MHFTYKYKTVLRLRWTSNSALCCFRSRPEYDIYSLNIYGLCDYGLSQLIAVVTYIDRTTINNKKTLTDRAIWNSYSGVSKSTNVILMCSGVYLQWTVIGPASGGLHALTLRRKARKGVGCSGTPWSGQAVNWNCRTSRLSLLPLYSEHTKHTKTTGSVYGKKFVWHVWVREELDWEKERESRGRRESNRKQGCDCERKIVWGWCDRAMECDCVYVRLGIHASESCKQSASEEQVFTITFFYLLPLRSMISEKRKICL